MKKLVINESLDTNKSEIVAEIVRVGAWPQVHIVHNYVAEVKYITDNKTRLEESSDTLIKINKHFNDEEEAEKFINTSAFKKLMKAAAFLKDL